MHDGKLASRTPFSAPWKIAAAAHTLAIADCNGVNIATIIVRRNSHELLARRLHERFNIELPSGPRRTVSESGDVALIGTGRGVWLALCGASRLTFLQGLRETVGATASVSDQSDAFGLLRLRGEKAHHVLAKLLPIDLHPRAFKPGSAATTLTGHIDITIWQLSDAAGDGPVYEIAVPRSCAASFQHALTTAAAEFG